MLKLKLALVFFVPFFLATSSLAADESDNWANDFNEKLMVAQLSDNTHAFIVRFWLEPRELENARPIWRGVIEHVASGRKLYLKNLEEIKAFIAFYLPEIGAMR